MCFSPFFSKGALTATSFQFSSCCYNFAATFVCISTQKAWGPLYQLPYPTLQNIFVPPFSRCSADFRPILFEQNLGLGQKPDQLFFLSQNVIDDIINVTHQNSSETVSTTKPCTCVRISLFIVQLILSKWPSKPYPFDSLPIKTLKFFSKNSEAFFPRTQKLSEWCKTGSGPIISFY